MQSALLLNGVVYPYWLHDKIPW